MRFAEAVDGLGPPPRAPRIRDGDRPAIAARRAGRGAQPVNGFRETYFREPH
jgi:hypothetical protein